MSELSVQPFDGPFGAWVHTDANKLLKDSVIQQCLAALDRYGVIVFPELGISDELQVKFSSQLGTLEGSKFSQKGKSEADDLGIYPVTLDPSRAKFIDYILSNEHWHMDGTTYQVPPKATNLRCVVPPKKDGETGFANLFLAYADLPDEQKAKIDGLRVVHSAATANFKTFQHPSVLDVQRWLRDGPPVEHPLVWHQADGRSSLMIGSTADSIAGIGLEEGRALLQELLDWCTQPRYCYRHTWSKGDMVIWNNPGMLHRAYPYTLDSGRMMHRTTIMGSEAIQ